MPTIYCTECGSPSSYSIGSKPSRCGRCKNEFEKPSLQSGARARTRAKTKIEKPLPRPKQPQPFLDSIEDEEEYYSQEESYDDYEESYDYQSLVASFRNGRGFVVEGRPVSKIGKFGDLTKPKDGGSEEDQ